MERAQRTGSVHHSSKEGKLLFRTPNLQLLLSQKISYLDQVFHRLLFQFGLEFIDRKIFRPDRLCLYRRVREGFSEFQPL